MTHDNDAGFTAFEHFLSHWSRRDFLRRMGAGAALAGFMAGGSAFLAACGGGGQQGGGGGTPKNGGHVVEGSIADLKTMNPVLVSDTIGALISSMLYDSLYMDDDKGSPQPLLARALPGISSDGRTYTVSLVDAAWTDGKPITADDVKFTYDLMFDPKYETVNSPRRGDLTTYLESVTVKDLKTVVFQLKQVYSPFISVHLEYGILPKHVWESLSPTDINTTELNTKPTVTSGPFLDANWQKGTQTTMKVNANYHRGRPHVDTWVYKVIGNSTESLNQLKTGEIDISNGLDPSQYDAARAVSNLDVRSYTALNFMFYMYNLDPAKSKLWQDKRVRQALFYALDREAMVKAVYFGQGSVANSTEPPASWAFQEVQPQYKFDKGKAEQLLDAAGFKKASDGIRARGEVKLQFEMLTNKDNQTRMNLLTAMQNQWKEIGVDATPRGVDFNLELIPQITNQRTFQVLLVGFQWSNDPDQAQVYGSASAIPGGFNGMSYKNTELDKVLNDAVGTLDRNRRKSLYKKMQEILAEDVPAPVLLFSNDIVVTNKRVQGFTPNAFATRYDGRRWYIKDVHVTDGK
jgi:peptide/nickel transport system substrate-binding protein